MEQVQDVIEFQGGIYEKYRDMSDMEFVLSYDLDTCHTRGNETILELDVAVALVRSEGHLADTARMLGQSRRRIENYVSRNRLLSELFEDIEAVFLDDIERAHRKEALGGDSKAQRFFLMTKGKGRGYVTRQENTGKGGTPLAVALMGNDAEL